MGRRPFPGWAIALAMIPPGWLFVLRTNRWHLTTASFLMMLCWAALIATGYWVATMALASVDDGDSDWFRVRGRRDDLEREKKSLLKAIKEIEFDRETGKMSAADAADLIGVYRARAIETIKALESLEAVDREGGLTGVSPREKIMAELRARAAVDAKTKGNNKKKKGKPAAAAPAPEPTAAPAAEPAADDVKEEAS